MKRTKGFTLVELLVVIAIISILASIAVPNITQFMERARMTKAEAEIDSITTALTAMLADSGKRDFSGRGFFSEFPTNLAIGEAVDVYSQAFYALLLLGNDAELDNNWPGGVAVNDNVLRALGNSYMGDLTNDPWDRRYQIFPGPWRGWAGVSEIPFRSVNADESLPGVSTQGTFDHTDPDTNTATTVGYPAQRTKVFYIFSTGGNLVANQAYSDGYYDEFGEPNFVGGGDDIGNWDKMKSYATFYR
jgi:prepilin-type N-terminal cleavage/methylation domain-containing protein